MRSLLLSSSRVAGAGFLDAYQAALTGFLGGGARSAVFVPYASVTVGWDEYAALAVARFAQLGVRLTSLHAARDPAAALADADAIVVGGGNTFRLLEQLQRFELLGAIRARVVAGAAYVGWSAGANLAGPTIRTTNDMPIVAPAGLAALHLVGFQINPHYTDALPDGHQGETRDQRIAEFLALQPDALVVGLREGSALELDGTRVTLHGPHPLRLFRAGAVPQEVGPDQAGAALAGALDPG